LIGGLYVTTKNIKRVEEIALATNWHLMFSLIDPSFHQGLVSEEKVKIFIEKHIGKIHFPRL